MSEDAFNRLGERKQVLLLLLLLYASLDSHPALWRLPVDLERKGPPDLPPFIMPPAPPGPPCFNSEEPAAAAARAASPPGTAVRTNLSMESAQTTRPQ